MFLNKSRSFILKYSLNLSLLGFFIFFYFLNPSTTQASPQKNLIFNSCARVFSQSFLADSHFKPTDSNPVPTQEVSKGLDRYVQHYSKNDWAFFINHLIENQSPLISSEILNGRLTSKVKEQAIDDISSLRAELNRTFQNYTAKLWIDITHNGLRERSLMEQWQFRSGLEIQQWSQLKELSQLRQKALLNRLRPSTSIAPETLRQIENFCENVSFQLIHHTHVQFGPNDKTSLLSSTQLHRLQLGQASLNTNRFNSEYLGTGDNLFFLAEPYHKAHEPPERSPRQNYGTNSIILRSAELEGLWASPHIMYTIDLKKNLIDSLGLKTSTQTIVESIKEGLTYQGGPKDFTDDPRMKETLIELREALSEYDLLWKDMEPLLISGLKSALIRQGELSPETLQALLIKLKDQYELHVFFKDEVFPALGWGRSGIEVKVPMALLEGEFTIRQTLPPSYQRNFLRPIGQKNPAPF